MRQSHERLLAAKGIVIGKAIRCKAVSALTASDSARNSLLIFRGKLSGPSWPTIAFQLDEAGLDYSLVEVGKVWIVSADSPRVRSVLQELPERARDSLRQQVFVSDVGFVNAERNKKFEPRVLIGPVLLLVLGLSVSLVPAATQELIEPTIAESPQLACALDLSEADLENWIASKINLTLSSISKDVRVESSLGVLNLQVEQTIGSTQSISGSIQCEDGRTKSLRYRIDASANGNLVKLGQRLDP